jgi:hypothetical protein
MNDEHKMDKQGKPNNLSASFNYDATPFANDLRETARNIRRRTAMCVLDNGRDFVMWRDRLKPMQYRHWVEEECGFTVRTAELAMMVWRYVEEASDRREIISLMAPTVQYLVAAPSTPESVRNHVIQCYAKGQRLKVNNLNELLRVAKNLAAESDSAARDLSDDQTRAHEQLRRTSRMADAQATSQQATASRVREGADCDQLVASDPETVRPIEDASFSYLQQIIEILGTQVAAKGLLIELFQKAGYSDLAHGLQDFERELFRTAHSGRSAPDDLIA